MKNFNIVINNIFLFSLLTLQLLENGTFCLKALQKLSNGHVRDGSLTHNPETPDALCPWYVALYLAVKHVSWPDGHVTVCIVWLGAWDSVKIFVPIVHLMPYPGK